MSAAGSRAGGTEPGRKITPRHHTERLAHLLDTAFRIPGTNFRFGLDPLIGLVPGLGDLLAGALSSYILVVAAQAGAPKSVLLRMTANVAIDALLGAVPLLGDFFDAWWKANTRNLDLLKRYQTRPDRTRQASTAYVVLLLLVVALVVIGGVALVLLLIGALINAIS